MGNVGECHAVLGTLAAGSAHVCPTSPPYWGRRVYGTDPVDWPAVEYVPMAGLPPVHVEPWCGELGAEPTPEAYVGHLVEVMRAALAQGRRFVGCESFDRYVPIARRRLTAAERQQVLPLATAVQP